MTDKQIIALLDNFPTNTSRLVNKESYFWVVYENLKAASHFLEIGYRKGVFVEVCKALGIKSVHLDISDQLLRAKPTDTNRCMTINSLDYLKECDEQFDLIFQDGCKKFKTRIKEYDYIVSKNILSPGGKIIVDDLHYSDCQKAFDMVIKKYGYQHKIFQCRDKQNYPVGLLWPPASESNDAK